MKAQRVANQQGVCYMLFVLDLSFTTKDMYNESAIFAKTKGVYLYGTIGCIRLLECLYCELFHR